MSRLTTPTFRNWRIHSYPASNVATIVPHKIGTRFTEEELSSILGWLKDNGLRSLKQSATSIRVISSEIQSLDLENCGMAGVKIDKAIEKEEARLRKEQERRKSELDEYNALPSSLWIEKEFREADLNQYNKLRLAEYLDGKANKFAGLINWKWGETVTRLEALTPDGQGVDFDKLRLSYSCN